MPDLYVANCTKQTHDFLFRRPESGRILQYPIPPGAQERVLKDASDAEIAQVVAHHTLYGMVEAKHVRSAKTFTGLCYSIGKPVDVDAIVDVLHQGEAVRAAQARTGREAISANLGEKLDENFRNSGTQARVARVETQTEDQVKPTEQQTFNEGVEVPAQGVAPRRRKH